MAREREHRGEIQASTLPIPNFKAFCKKLYKEGLAYDWLKKKVAVERIGTHTSILLHDYPRRDGRWISIHYREGLESLVGNEMSLTWARVFRKNVGADLCRLSERLLGDLRDVDMIYGLSQVSANWGENHRFITEIFSKDPGVVRRHVQSITGLPPRTNGQAPLTLFAIGRNELIGEFYREGSSEPKAPVSDLVGN